MGLAESTTSPGTGRKSIAGSFAPFRGSVFQILNRTAYAVGYVLPPSGLNMIPQTFRCANRAPLVRRALLGLGARRRSERAVMCTVSGHGLSRAVNASAMKASATAHGSGRG